MRVCPSVVVCSSVCPSESSASGVCVPLKVVNVLIALVESGVFTDKKSLF